MNRELEFYNEVKNWDFSKIKYIEECLTNWNMYDILSTPRSTMILGRFSCLPLGLT